MVAHSLTARMHLPIDASLVATPLGAIAGSCDTTEQPLGQSRLLLMPSFSGPPVQQLSSHFMWRACRQGWCVGGGCGVEVCLCTHASQLYPMMYSAPAGLCQGVAAETYSNCHHTACENNSDSLTNDVVKWFVGRTTRKHTQSGTKKSAAK